MFVKRALHVPVTVAVLGVLLAGCSPTTTVSSDRSAAPSDSASSSSAAEQVDGAGAESSAAAPTEALRTVFGFGESAALEGEAPMTLLVTAPEPFTPSEYAVVGQGEPHTFVVTLTNTGAQLLDPSLVSVTAQSGGAESEQVFDSENGLSGSPSTSLLPGGSVTWAVGFGLVDPNAVVLEVTPGFTAESVVFTNQATS